MIPFLNNETKERFAFLAYGEDFIFFDYKNPLSIPRDLRNDIFLDIQFLLCGNENLRLIHSFLITLLDEPYDNVEYNITSCLSFVEL